MQSISKTFFQEGKTFKAKKQFFKGSKRDQLHEYIVVTLGGGNLRSAVKLPIKEDKCEWLAVNTVDFFNQINLLYGCISEFCNKETCPTMTAGPKYEYFWADGQSIVKPIQCSAQEYVDYLMTWIENQLDNEKVFPSNSEFPDDFEKTIKTIFKRLFRVYAHIYHCHIRKIEELGEDAHLNTCFKHFILFVDEFDLVDKKEQQPLSAIVSQIIDKDP